MIKDALEFLKQSTIDASFPRVVNAPEPPGVYLIAKADGSFERVTAIPRSRSHAVSDIASLVRALTDCSQLDTRAFTTGGQPAESKHAIWYGRNEVVGIFDDAVRFDRVSLELGVSPQVESLQQLENTQVWKDQKGLLRFLRHDMADCLGQSDGIIATVRAVKFYVNQSGEATRSQGKASIGNKIEAELTGAGALPEYIVFSVPVFANPQVTIMQNIGCSLDVDEMAQKFCIQPVPMAIEQAISAAEVELGKRVRAAIQSGTESSFVVLAGSPE